MSLSASEAIPRLLEQLLDLAEKIDGGRRSPFLREIEERTDEIATIVAADADLMLNEVDLKQWDQYRLTHTERVILTMLARQPGKYVKRTAIKDRLYRGKPREADDGVINVYMTRIRRAIEQSGYTIFNNYTGAYTLARKDEYRVQDPITFIEWHGILMGSKQAKIAEVLHSRLGQCISFHEIVIATQERSFSSLVSRMPGLRRHMSKAPFEIDTLTGRGYRMRLRATS